MEAGWLTDFGQYRWEFVRWEKGAPEAAILAGVKPPQHPLPVISYCCVNCGYVEMYVPRNRQD